MVTQERSSNDRMASALAVGSSNGAFAFDCVSMCGAHEARTTNGWRRLLTATVIAAGADG
jgi:hypothetical protein